MTRIDVTASVGLLALASANAAIAQGSTPSAVNPASATSRTTSYPAAFFTQYAPRNALDIARRVPGFSLDLGDNDVRGFSGAAGNVVLNGARPSSKSESLEQTLSRIPAQQVTSVELGPGDLFGADYAGKTQVLNITLAAGSGGGVEGNLTASARRFTNRSLIVPDGSASIVVHRGPSQFDISAGLTRTDSIENGTDDQFISANESPFEHRIKINKYLQRQPFGAISWSLGSTADNSSHLNVRIQKDVNGVRQTNHVVPAVGAEHDDTFVQRYNQPGFEIGGDIARPAMGGAVKLVALATRKHRNYKDIYSGGPPALGGFRQVQIAGQAETVGRLSWSRTNLGGFSFESGAETAYNSLDNRLTFSVIDLDGSETAIDLPIDNAKVTEKRAEAYLTLGRSLGPTLHFDSGVRYETSQLEVRGDAQADRSLSFWKPNVALDWNDRGWHARAAIRRTVAQLNFYDFISAADISAGRVNGGNANLVPQQTWEYRFTLDHPLLKTGLVKLDLGYDRVNQLQDSILTEDGFDAPGNLGTGTRRFVSLAVDAPLDQLGIKAGRLKAGATIQRTRVEDPSTHLQRNWSDFWPNWQWNLEYRQDLGRFSYGAAAQDRSRFAFYRTDEIDLQRNAGIFGTAFLEYRPNPKTSVTFDLDNLFDTQSLRQRKFFSPNRTNPAPSGSEFRARNRHVTFGVTLKRAL